MELSTESLCQHVTWKVRDFLQLSMKSTHSLDSPEIRFANDSYCLRLYPCSYSSHNTVRIVLIRLTSCHSKWKVSCKMGYRWRNGKGDKFDKYWSSNSFFSDICDVRFNNDNRDMCDPDGTLTALCSMRLSEQNSAGSPQSGVVETSDAEEQQEVLAGQPLFFSSRWWSSERELSVESSYQHVTWKVQDFFQLPSEIGYSLESPHFRYAGDSYCLRFYPNGDIADSYFRLVRLTSTFPERLLLCNVGSRMVDVKGNEFDIYQCPGTLNDKFSFLLLSRCELEKERDTWFPDSTLTLLFSMRVVELSSAGSLLSDEAGISDAEVKQGRLLGVAKLLSDYRQLMEKGVESDACLVVDEKEFRAHRCVLRSRSAVFDAMFGHETAEKESGRVVINDLDPTYFGDFLEYLYTGSVGAGLSDDKAFGLYAAANKYDVPTLKSECVAYMRRSLSVDSFFDVLTLAVSHREEDLLQRVVEFFKENLPRIIVNEKWQQFVIDNGKRANEFLMKAFGPRGQ